MIKEIVERYTKGETFKQSSGEGRSFTMEYRHDPIADTVGRVGALPEQLLLWTPEAMLKAPTQEQAAEWFDAWKDVPWKGDVLVRVDHTSVWGDIKRNFAGDIQGRPNIFLRTLVLPGSMIQSFGAKFFRENYYNPFTKTAHAFNTNKAVGFHEIGHAQFFDNQKYPGLVAFFKGLPGINAFVEWKATSNAMKRIPATQQNRASEVLAPALGSYIATDAVRLVNPFVPRKAAETMIKIATWAPIAGFVSGHIVARVPGVKEHVRWALGGEKPDHAFSLRHAYEQSTVQAKESWARLGRVFGGDEHTPDFMARVDAVLNKIIPRQNPAVAPHA